MRSPLLKYSDRENGFTLIELLIVVLIIGVLAAIAVPVYLGIQNQAHKSAVKSDVNITVKRVQVALTEGTSLATIKANNAPYVQVSEPGESVTINDSIASTDLKQFAVIGGESKNATPKPGAIDYTYIYDSATGKFSETNAAYTAPSIAINTASLPDAVKDTNYSKQVDVTAVNTTGTSQYNAIGLPTGITINQATGLIDGTAGTVGSYNVTVTVTNGSLSDSRSYTLAVTSVPSISTSSLPAALTGTSYSQTLAATGSPATFTYALAGGALPTGVTLNTTTGVISGTPTVAGTANFTVTATNTAGTSTPKALSIVVNSVPTISTPTPANATINTQYSTFVAATGAPSPTYAVSSGALPTGLGLNAGTGEISGTPTASGPFTFKVTATNSVGSATTNTITLEVYAPPTITNTTLGDFFKGAGTTQQLAFTGYPTPTLTATDSLAPCITYTATGLLKENGCTISPTGYVSGFTVSNAAGSSTSYLAYQIRGATTADIANYNFNAGSTGWSGDGNFGTATDPTGRRGTSLHVTSSATTAQSVLGPTITYSGGRTYIVTAYIYIVSGNAVGGTGFLASGTTYGRSAVAPLNTWVPVQYALTVTGNGTLNMQAFAQASAPAGALDYYVDDVRISVMD